MTGVSEDTKALGLVEVLDNEDGDCVFALGHVDEQAFRISLALHAFYEWTMNRSEAFDIATSWAFSQEWMRNTSGDDDAPMEQCDADAEGAIAFTILREPAPKSSASSLVVSE